MHKCTKKIFARLYKIRQRTLLTVSNMRMGRREWRYWSKGWGSRRDDIVISPFSRLDLGNSLPPQAERDRGILESVTSNPTGVAILRFVLGTGTHPAFLLHAGTSGLLAILQLGACPTGSDNFSGRTCLSRRKIHRPLDTQCSSSSTDSCARSWHTWKQRNSPG